VGADCALALIGWLLFCAPLLTILYAMGMALIWSFGRLFNR
jgi:hypothetical protein